MLLDIQRLKDGQFAKRLSWDSFFLGVKATHFRLYELETENTVVTSTSKVWNPLTEDLLANDWEYFLDPYGHTKVVEFATSSYIMPPNPPVTNPPVTITPFKFYTNPLF